MSTKINVYFKRFLFKTHYNITFIVYTYLYDVLNYDLRTGDFSQR